MLKFLAVPAILALALQLPALAGQKEMKEALNSLEEAKEHLENASSGKGGHRKRAVELVDEAISEVEEGIEYHRNSR